jgi:hypothetical protein
MREIKSKFDKDLSKNIMAIKKAIQNLRALGLKIEIDKDVETLMGGTVNNIYVRDYLGNHQKIILQKHLLTIEKGY